MRNYKVYKLTSPSNKVYIGVTGKSLTKRWSGGNGYRHCPAMYKCVKKYGLAPANLCKCLKGERHIIGGFHWRYSTP